MDTRRLFVKGLSDKTTSDALQSYMEVVSGVDVLTAELGGEACAIVTFDEYYDYEAVTKKISRKPLEGKTPVVEQLPVCHCVQVSGFNKEKTTKDTVRYYFESPKNKGGDVSSVELNLKEGWALVYFEDPKVVLNVVAKSHFLSGAELDVRPHYSLLGKPQPVKADIELVQNIAVDGMKMQFILEHCKVDLTEVQNSYDVQMTWDESTHSVTVTPKDKASGDKHSFDEACEAIASFIADFVKSSTRVPPQAWNHVVDHFKKTKSPAQENLRVDCIPEQHAFLLIGKKQDVEDVTEELEGMIEEIDKRLKREASKIERTVVIPYTRLQFLKHLEFAKELESQHEEVEVTILPEKGVVQIRGPPETIHKVTAAIWEAVAKMKDVKLNLPRNHLALLRSTPCQAFIRDMFTANNLQAIIASDEKEGNLFVLGTESDITEKALDLVKTLIVEECVDLDEDQVQLEKSEKWHLLREEMREKRIITLSFDESNKKICLLGVKEDVSDVVKAVNRFLEENTIISSVVTLPKGCRRFLVKYREQELRQIQEELKEYSTRIKSLVDEDEKDLIVSGTTCGVDKATELIQDLASKVQSQKMLVSKPGMRKVLDRGKGQKLLAMLENENECVIEYCKLRKAGAKEVKEVKKAEKKKESLCDLLTPDGKRILVFKDNICNRNVNVIVNAANSKLQHVGGVSKAIYERAGEAFRAECDRFIVDAGPLLDGQVAVTSAGKLPFQKVIHAVGPQWEKKAAQEKSMGKIPIQEKKLSYALKNALDVAKSYNSVAIPAIGTGVFEFPRELCAHFMVESVLAFFRENPSCFLSEVQFTSTDESVVKAFAKEMDSRFLNDPNYQSSLDPKRKEKDTKEKGRATSIPDMSPAIVSSNTAPNVIKTPEGLELVLVIGDMYCEKVDVIVNSTSSDLNLSANASAMALSAAAGPRLQQECNTIGKVDTGEIVVTSGANLACKHVFHTSCAGWENGAGEKVLRDIIKKCLEEAQKRSLSTISIPAIGTGNLNFPRDCVAAASFDEAVVFSKKNPSTSLKAVHLVVYDKDLQSLQAFQTELQKRGGVGPPPPQPPAGTVDPKHGKKKRRGWRGGNTKRSDLDTPDDVGDTLEEEPMMLNPLQPEIMIGNVVVQAETGNITKEATDAIATLSNSELDVALGGGVGKAILAAGGPTIQTECSSMGSQKPGSVVVSGAGKLQVGKIYHMVPDYGTSMHSITDCILECLRKAESDGLTSISFPAVGTGNINKDAKEAAEGMMSAIFKFAREEPVSIALVRIVIYQPHMLTVFQTAMEASLSSEKGGTGFLSKLAGWFGFGRITSASSHSMSSMRIFQGKGKPFSYIEIFAGTKQDIDAVIKKIEKDVADHCTQKVIEREAICNLSKEQTQQIKKLEAEYDVTVNLEQSIGRISVRGDAEDVLDVATTIYDVLNQKIEEEHTKGVGELLSKNVQWFSYGSDGDETPEPYEPSINFQIEEAFREGKDSLIVLIDEAKCKIAFKDMTETCLDDGEVRVVVRKEIGKGVPLPLEWDVHPKDGSGKEKEVHLVLLDPNASEYKKVADEVRKTSPVNIIKIERVQNPVLYRQYMVRRDQMEHKNGGNEKQLFHGTAASSCPTLSKFGFNRSYCGKNATVYGNGVYFARDASYSTQKTYSPPDATGNRHIYLARVLAGEYTTGRQGMITPPPKGSDATDAYDSVVDNPTNPTIFVVFYDNQCYPDYLITFR
ncbi:poly [ADP-ribose] polymerase 14-like [Stylophora pistillata]|nr:poly [ADP-ribose] polymerase 14-like [Stylophora pistillata]